MTISNLVSAQDSTVVSSNDAFIQDLESTIAGEISKSVNSDKVKAIIDQKVKDQIKKSANTIVSDFIDSLRKGLNLDENANEGINAVVDFETNTIVITSSTLDANG